jgi:hypothetical protein
VTPFEQTSKKTLQDAGWKVYRNGWPDFLCVRTLSDGSSEVAFVEVKARNDYMRPEQNILHDVLSRAGLSVHIVKPERRNDLVPELPIELKNEQTRKSLNELRTIKNKVSAISNDVPGKKLLALRRLLGLKEASEFLGISEPEVVRLCEAKQLAHMDFK